MCDDLSPYLLNMTINLFSVLTVYNLVIYIVDNMKLFNDNKKVLKNNKNHIFLVILKRES